MTLLNGNAPVLSVEDSFSLVYNGSYGKVVYDRVTQIDSVETITGPLPEGFYVWDGVDYLGGAEEGEERFVPFDVVRLYFGDPRSIMSQGQRFETRKGDPGDIAPRQEETRRLSVLYGLYSTDIFKLDSIVPDCTIKTAKGEEIITPAVDPQGKNIYGHVSSTNAAYDQATTIEQLKNQLAMLEEAQKALERRGNDNSGSDVEVDGPPATRGTAG